MTIKASDTNELLCDNNTLRLITSIGQIFLDFRKLGFLDKIFSKKQVFLFPTKFIRMSRQIKQGEYCQQTKKMQTSSCDIPINFVGNKKNCFLILRS